MKIIKSFLDGADIYLQLTLNYIMLVIVLFYWIKYIFILLNKYLIIFYHIIILLVNIV